MTDAMGFFDRLGARVDVLWQLQDYDEARFPMVAYQALEELPPHRHTSMIDVVAGATAMSCLPLQNDISATFGDPPLTVFEGRSFRIEVLFWLRGAPAIHQHSFSGAFHVLEGASIHTRWRFNPVERIDMRLLLGQVDFCDVEILHKGENREILAGSRMFHATYHMDKPSLTVVIRTHNESDNLPQYMLKPPHVAYAIFHRQDSVVRQAQLLNTMLQVRQVEGLALLRRLLNMKDSYWTFEVLYMVLGAIEDEDARYQVLATARQRNPRLLRALEATLDRSFREDRIMRTRIAVGDDSELRYLLALLRNVPDGEEIIRLVGARYPEQDIVSLIVNWIRRLGEKGVLGFDLHESWLMTLRALLRGATEEQILRDFNDEAVTPGAPRDISDVRELCAAIRNSWLLSPLFFRTRARVS